MMLARGDMIAVRSPQGDLFCEGCAPDEIKVCLSCGEAATERGCEVIEHPGCGLAHPETAVAMEDEIAGVQPLWQGDKRLLPGATCKKCEKVFGRETSPPSPTSPTSPAEYVYDKNGRTPGPCGDCGTAMVWVGSEDQAVRTAVCLNCRANGRPKLAVLADAAMADEVLARRKRNGNSR